MKLQIFAVLFAMTFAIEITTIQGANEFPRQIRDSRGPALADHHDSHSAKSVFRSNDQQKNGAGAHSAIGDRRDVHNNKNHAKSKSYFVPLIHHTNSKSDHFVVIPNAFRVINNNPHPDINDGKLVPWKTVVTEVNDKIDEEIDKKLKEDKKDIKEIEQIIKKDVEILKKVEKIESEILAPADAKKVAQMEEKIIDHINNQEKKVQDIKADEVKTTDLKELNKEVKEIKKEEAKAEAKAEAKKENEKSIAQIDAKIKEAIVLEIAEQKMAPKVIENIKAEIRKQEENRNANDDKNGDKNSITLLNKDNVINKIAVGATSG
jgi:hypothetical protein